MKKLAISQQPALFIPPERRVHAVRCDERISSTLGVGRVARPLIGVRFERGTSPHWIELDVSIARQEVSVSIDGPGAIASFPERSGSRNTLVEIPNVLSA